MPKAKRTKTPPPPRSGPLRAALYVRVSKADGSQTTENQRPLLEALALKREWPVTFVYEDNESGKSGDRPAFQSMLADAQARKFDVLLFWSLDRFTREGSFATLEYLNRLSGWGVAYLSHQEQYLDTVGPFRDAIVAILAAIAQQERLRLSERVKAGLARARANGVKLGQPVKVPNLDYFRRADKVYNTRELMELFQCGRSHIYKCRAMLRDQDHEQLTQAQPQTQPQPQPQTPVPDLTPASA